jgi:hypothetical protein
MGIAIGLAVALLLPLLVVAVPPFADFYFHLARMVVLDNPTAPYVRDWYALDWRVMPNLAMDLIVPALAKFMPLTIASRVFVGLTLAMIFTGTLALHHALYRRLSWFPLVAALFVYNQIVFFGFINYLFGIGLTLWAAAGWFYLGRHSYVARIAFGGVAGLAIYICHLFALGIFGLIIASAELDALSYDRRIVRHLVLTTAPFLVPLALLMNSRTIEASRTLFEYLWIVKLFAAFTLFVTINPPVDLFIMACILLGTYVLVRQRTLFVSPRLRFAIVAFPVLVVLMPSGIIGSFYTDLRLPTAAIFVTIAACRLQASQRLQLLTAASLTGLLILRIAALIIDFRVADAEMGEFRNQFSHLRPGSVIFTGALKDKAFLVDAVSTADNWKGLSSRDNTLPLTHITTIALLDQIVFVPEATMIDGQQPTKMKKEFLALKALQADENHRWYSFHDAHELDEESVGSWLDRIKTTVLKYHFSAVYVALLDRGAVAVTPPEVTELYTGHGYRLWDVSPLIFGRTLPIKALCPET